MAILAAGGTFTHFNGNDVYLEIDGEDVSGLWIDGTLTMTNNAVEVTAGSGTDYVQRASGLYDTSLELTIAYSVEHVASQVSKMKPGIHTVVIGVEGNTAGKPKHQQSFHFGSSAFSQAVGKDEVSFSLSASGNGLPTTNMWDGGTF